MNAPRAGAYGRRGGNVAPTVVLPEHLVRYDVHEGWRVYADTSDGVRFCPCKANEKHARKVHAVWRSMGERRIRDSHANAVFVGGVILSPDDVVVDTWGGGCVPGKPRWPGLARTSSWTTCTGCSAVLWPYRLVLDGRCRACVTELEVADPRPAWPGEALAPPRREWPKWVTSL